MNGIDVFSADTHFAAGEKWSCAAADIAANFPACKFLLHEDDIVDDVTTEWVDRVGGVEVTCDAAFNKTSAGVYGTGTFVVTGDMPASGTKEFVMVVDGLWNASGATTILGDIAAGAGIAIAGATNRNIMLDASNFAVSEVLSVLPTYPFAGCMSLHADLGDNEARKSAASNDGAYTGSSVKASSTGTIAGPWPALANSITLGTTDTNAKRIIALFAFTNLPHDTAIANMWMAANPGKLYPGWAGRS